MDWNAGETEYTYGHSMVMAREKGRIGKVSYMESLPVHTAWDLGIRDSTAIWFFQIYGVNRHIIDFEHGTGKGVFYYADLLKSKPYKYGVHGWPHDGKNRVFATGVTQQTTMAEHGLDVEIIPRTTSIYGGIEAVRKSFPLMYFDEGKCKEGIKSLDLYNKMNGHTKQDKFHSNPADALRTLCDGMERGIFFEAETVRPKIVQLPGAVDGW
ncbi:MAG: hypothetical protein HRT36_06995 [Alphaproteobacteria bacterium]|nr:hypothetical protein [Alphaproteobacteria bacterium]